MTLFAATALVFGCKEQKEPEPAIPVLNVGQTELSFEQNGGTATVTVTSNRPWSISTDADWLAFSPSNGSASDAPVSVTVTALSNTSNDRTSSFKVKTDFDFKTVTVSQKGQKGEDPNVTPSGSGTASDPYNVAAALQKAQSLVAYNNGDELGSQNSATVYTKGKVVSVEIDPSYGNATYYISADGTAETQLEVYRGKYINGDNFIMADQLKVGDEVVVYGTLVNFKGNAPEYTAGSKLISINGSTEPGKIDFTKFELITVQAFIDKADKANFYRLKGKVSRFNKEYCSFDLTDDSGKIYVYNVNNKDEWVDKIKNGGTIELAGLYTYYEKNSQHEVVSAQILSFEGGSDTPSGDPKGTGTLEDPYNPAGAAAAVKDLTWTSNDNYETTDVVYVKGKICKIASNGTFTEGIKYGNASFFISEDGTGEGEFHIFRTLYLGNKKFAEGQTDIKVGDEVIICGKLMNYHGNTPETDANNSYLYSLNGVTGGDDPGPGGDDYTSAEPKTVADFISAADKNTYFKLTGTVSKFNSQYCSFDLTDDSGTIYVYSVANKNEWSSKVSNEGTVTLAGKYDYYSAKEQHEVVQAYILSFEAAAPPEAQDATVAEAIAADNDTQLKVGPAVVVASADAGFLMEQDGAKIYVYGSKAKVGDKVTVTGKKVEYGDAPQLSEATVETNSTGVEVSYPEAKDITSSVDTYSSDTREFVTLKGKLSISNNKYFNIVVDGATTVTGSIVKPVEDIASLNEKEVTIKGYYLYHTSQGKYLYVIATEINGIAITGEGGDTPGGDTPGGEVSGDFTSNVEWTKGESASDAKATVNGKEITALKLGTSTKTGTATIVLPKGSTSLSFYGVSWKAKKAKLLAKIGEKEFFSQDLATNDGAAGNPPFTMTVTSSDCYTKTFDALASDTTVTLTTTGTNTRIILFGINVK